MGKHKTTIGVAIAVIVSLSVAFFLFTNIFVDSAGTPYEPEVKWSTKQINVIPGLVVIAGNKKVLENSDLTFEEAQSECESIAFNSDHMWEQVICYYDGSEIYNNVFVAG